jgi:hypothetical protein
MPKDCQYLIFSITFIDALRFSGECHLSSILGASLVRKLRVWLTWATNKPAHRPGRKACTSVVDAENGCRVFMLLLYCLVFGDKDRKSLGFDVPIFLWLAKRNIRAPVVLETVHINMEEIG